MEPVLATLADLIRINSINPSYANGRPEGEICAFIRDFFARRGVETFEQEVAPGRPNLIARVPGRQPGRRVILEAHVDTASIDGMTIPPFEPRVRDGRMYGRGSCDTKAGLAGMMHAAAWFSEHGVMPECEVWMVAAADEEFSFRGVTRLCQDVEAEAAIVAEPTEMRCVVASKGVLRWKIHTHGVAAHSSKPHLGRNAISAMARVVEAVEEDAARLSAARVHPLLGPGTANIGVIRGGVQVNFVPDHCEIEIDRRLLPGERVTEVLAQYRSLLDRAGAHDATMDTPMLEDEALETPADTSVVRVASSVLHSMGWNGEPAGVPYGSDASKLSRAGVPSIIFGPGSIDQAHAAVEYVDCGQVVQASRFYREFLQRFASN